MSNNLYETLLNKVRDTERLHSTKKEALLRTNMEQIQKINSFKASLSNLLRELDGKKMPNNSFFKIVENNNNVSLYEFPLNKALVSFSISFAKITNVPFATNDLEPAISLFTVDEVKESLLNSLVKHFTSHLPVLQ